MLKYESENSDGLLVEFMDEILKMYRHSKPKLSSNKRVIWSTITVSDSDGYLAYGFVSETGKNVVCILTEGKDEKEFHQLRKLAGIQL
jgi:hypothetical protein